MSDNKNNSRNCIPINDFFNNFVKNKFTLIIPEMQRMLSWDEKKINEIFSSNNENEYFGNITLSIKGNNVNVLDGQQRILTFLMARVISDKNWNNHIIETNQFIDDKKITSFANFFTGKINDDILDCLNDYGFKKNYNIFKKIEKENGKEFIFEKLNKVYVSYSIVDEKISEYQTFICLNSSGVELRSSDIIKAKFISLLDRKTSPTEIRRIWVEMIDYSYILSEYSKFEFRKNLSKFDVDYLISLFINIRTKKDMQKSKTLSYYLDDFFPKIEEEKKRYNINLSYNNFVIKEVQCMSKFVTTYYKSICYKADAKESIFKIYLSWILGFNLNTHLNTMNYFPILTIYIIISKLAFEKNSCDIFNYLISLFLKINILYLVNQSKDEKNHIRANTFRQKVKNYISTKYNDKLIDLYKEKEISSNEIVIKDYLINEVDIFDILNIDFKKTSTQYFIYDFYNCGSLPENNKNFKEDFSKKMVNDFLLNETFNYQDKKVHFLFQWYFEKHIIKSDDNNLNFNDWLKSFTVEHLLEAKYTKSDKNNSSYAVFLLEPDLHIELNRETKEIKNEDEIIRKKLNIYKKSKNWLTQKIGNYEFDVFSKPRFAEYVNNIMNDMMSKIFDFIYNVLIPNDLREINNIKNTEAKSINNKLKFIRNNNKFYNSRFEEIKNKSLNDILLSKNIKCSSKSKKFIILNEIIPYALNDISYKIINIGFRKNRDIKLKEEILFSNVDFNEFTKSISFEESKFYHDLKNKKIIFALWDEDDLKLVDFIEYIIDEEEIVDAKVLWANTTKIISKKINIVSEIKNNKKQYLFLKASDNLYFHLKPHDSKDIPRNVLPSGEKICNFSFYLNKRKIEEKINSFLEANAEIDNYE